jgi:tetratricopeptide (TPR) repeat protein
MSGAPVAGADPSFDAFLSYARADDPGFTDALVAGLARAGMRVWFDRDSLPSRGTTFDQEIRRAIQASARLLLLVGPNALSREYVAQEWGFADDLGIPVIPVLRTGSFEDLPERFRGYHSVPAQPPLAVDAVVTSLVRLLSEPVPPLGACHGVPPLAPHAFARPELLERVSLALGVDRQRPEEAGRAARSAALYGTSGVGKSTVAASFARAIRSRRSFSGGIVWLACGPSFQPLAGAREVLEQVAVGSKPPETTGELAPALAEGLAGREVLVVLDDVRDPDAATPFVGALGPGGRALLTTLDQAVATALGAVDIAVDQLDDASSRRLLEGWAGGSLPPEADAVVDACDGLPFALAIVGAMVRNRVPWGRVVEALEARRLDLLAARFPGYPYPNVLRAMAASYDALALDDPRAAACYLELAAFRPGATLTERVMVRLWSRPGRLTPLEASLVLPVLERRLLVQRRDAPDADRFILHGLHEDFVRLQSPNTAELEAELVTGYRVEKGAGDWSTLPDDGYVYDYLIAHLASLGDRDELIGAVNAAWVHRQLLRRGDLGQALDDVRVALDAAAAPPLDLASIGGLSLLSGQVVASLREAPANLVGALAEAGDVDQALRWAADHPDPSQRFDALVAVLEGLLRRGELARARGVVRTAAATIPHLGGVVESGTFSGLTAMNAVHALVDFPYPDQWEGTNDQLVATARIPLDALVRLAPIAARAGAIVELTNVSHPFWELYGHLIPLVAVEQLADEGEPGVAAALLDQRAAEQGSGDEADAARYRRAVASAALGRFEEARSAVDTLPASYHAVGYRGLARHLAAAGRVDDAIEVIGLIDDETVADQATEDLVEATIGRAQPEGCRRVAALMFKRDWTVAGAWLAAAGGDPSVGLGLLDRAPRDDLRLGLGIRLGDILHQGGRTDEAAGIVRQLVPAAERLLGPQWFAPETTSAEPQLASLGRTLRGLVARSGEPLPDAVTPLALVYETQVGSLPPFKLDLLIELVLAGRFAEARELAEVSSLPFGRGLALATALAVAGPAISEEVGRDAASSLADAVNDIEPGPSADTTLGAAMRTLTSGGLQNEAARVAEQLVPRPGLWSAVGVWALDRARAGEVDQIRRLVRQLLVERPLPVADARARAMVLAAVAERRGSASDELEAAAALLSDVQVAAGALDVVFEVVDLTARHRGREAAASFARSVADGSAAALAEQVLRGKSIDWEGGPSEQEIAAAAAARAVAAAGMVLVTSSNGPEDQGREWLQRAEALASQGERIAPNLGVAEAVGKYVAAARAVLEDTEVADDPGQMLLIAWLLWERGRSTQAVRYATRAVGRLSDPLAGAPQIISTEDWERRLNLFDAVRAGLHALVAVDAADRGDLPAVDAAASAMREGAPGWPALTLAERAEVRACLAIALQRAGAEEAAAEQLQEAVEPAFTLARRGEVDPFGRLCQALLELLPPDQAALIWAEWLIAAAAAGANEALGLIAAYVRWLPEDDLTEIVVSAQTGQLHSRP